MNERLDNSLRQTLPNVGRTILALACLAACTVAAGVAGCDDGGGSEAMQDTIASEDTAQRDSVSDSPSDTTGLDSARVCVGVRGNGSRIFSHFASLARIHEHYGLIDGIAGGSSGSITTFLTESMYANPYVFDCGGTPCSDEEAAARIALLFKSLAGYLELLSGTQEALAFQTLAPLVQAAFDEGIDELVESDRLEDARDALQTLLTSPDVADLVNDEVLDLLANSPDALYHTEDIWQQIASFGSFSTDSDRILIRPGIVDFAEVAHKLGRIGSLYAAYGDADAAAWQQFFEQCATPGRGMLWAEVAELDAGGVTCGEHFQSLAQSWRDGFLAAGEAPNRVDDTVGQHLPALVATSVLTGDTVTSWEQARADYLLAQPYTFEPSFDDVRFGYWGQPADLDAVESDVEGFGDAKTARAMGLGSGPWLTALSMSPAEPGLARALEIDENTLSAGGWPDLEPVPALANMGCDEVVLVTRRGSVETFGYGVARLLGMNDTEATALYGHTNPDSAVYVSLEAAGGVWCTDWDGQGGFDIAALTVDGWTAPLEVHSDIFTSVPTAYDNTSSDLGLAGCTPGAAP